jgi:hypothetical protein
MCGKERSYGRILRMCGKERSYGMGRLKVGSPDPVGIFD